MDGSDDRRATLPPLVVILLAFFGLYAGAPRGGPSSKPAEPQDQAASVPSARAWPGGEYPAGEQPIDRLFYPPADPDELKSIADGLTGRPRIDVMITTIAAPSHSSNSFEFDEFLAPIQRAAESQDYVLDHYRFPWGRRDGQTKADDAAPAKAAPSRNPAGEFGWLVFRRRSETRARGAEYLAVLLCTETPTSGVDRRALARALDVATRVYRLGRHAKAPDGALHILGPSFSGSQISLEDVLVEYRRRWDRLPVKIISGSALGISKAEFERRFPNGQVTYRATLHSSKVLLRSVLKYLRSGSTRQHQGVAMLVEANTAYGRESNVTLVKANTAYGRESHVQTEPDIFYYPFPAHIAAIRANYERENLISDAASRTIRGTARLAIPPDESGGVRDVPAPMTPATTAGTEEMALIEVLTDIGRRDLFAVGIVATDPRDVVFLGRMVREYCPDVRLFTNQSELLYLRPQSMQDLRGMLLATTYPLAMRNQWWSAPFKDNDRHVSFTSDTAEGTFNAMLFHLRELGIADNRLALSEYNPPILEGDPYSTDEPYPPVWLAAIGQRGVLPLVTDAEVSEERGYLCEAEARDFDRERLSSRRSPLYYGGWRILMWFLLAASAGLALATAAVERALAGQPFTGQWEYLRLPAQSLGWKFDQSGNLPELAEDLRGYNWAAYRVAAIYFVALTLLWTQIGFLWALALCLGVALVARSFPWKALFGQPKPKWLQRLGWDFAEPEDQGQPVRNWTLVLLVLAQLLLLFLLWTASGPLLIIAAWLPVTWSDSPYTWLSLATAALLVGSLTVSASGLARPQMFTKDTGRRRVRNLAVACAVLVPVSAVFFGWLFALAEGWGMHEFLRFERVMVLPGGITPVFPALFLVTAWSAAIAAELNRRYLRRTFEIERTQTADQTGQSGNPDGDQESPTLRGILQRARDARECADQSVKSQRGSVGRHLSAFAVGGLFFVFAAFPLVDPVLSRGYWQTFEPVWYETILGMLFLGIFGWLVFNLVYLVILWGEVRRVLRQIVLLPLGEAFDRLPRQVARWFYGGSVSDLERHSTVFQQSQALSALSDKARDALGQAAPRTVNAEVIDQLRTDLADIKGHKAVDLVLKILLELWEGQPAVPTAGGGSASDPKSSSEGPAHHSDHRDEASGTAPPDPREGELVARWTRTAEDLIALYAVRWIAPMLAQIWNVVGMLAIGGAALLLTVTSYPFTSQGKGMFAVGLLLAAIALAILNLLIGLNRDEVVSRVGNTGANFLNLDWAVVGNLVTYVLPLLGLLAAASFDIGDVFRDWLDPLFRMFD